MSKIFAKWVNNRTNYIFALKEVSTSMELVPLFMRLKLWKIACRFFLLKIDSLRKELDISSQYLSSMFKNKKIKRRRKILTHSKDWVQKGRLS